MRHEFRLSFDEFGWESLESEARREGETLDDLLSRAAAYFDAERSTSRAATLAPVFKPGGREMPREVRLDVNRDRWEDLESEAGRQGVPLERLLEHAALLYLADIDSGRLASRVLGSRGGESPVVERAVARGLIPHHPASGARASGARASRAWQVWRRPRSTPP